MDPTSGGGIGKAAGELLKEMEKAQSELQQLDQIQGGQTGGANFSNVMDAQNVPATNQVQGVQESHKVLLQAKVDANLPSTRVGAPDKAQNSKLTKMLEGLIGGQDRMTGIMNMALSGRQFSPPELIGLQAGVYRFSQELELTSKVVEKATSGIKQTMNTQV